MVNITPIKQSSLPCSGAMIITRKEIVSIKYLQASECEMGMKPKPTKYFLEKYKKHRISENEDHSINWSRIGAAISTQPGPARQHKTDQTPERIVVCHQKAT